MSSGAVPNCPGTHEDNSDCSSICYVSQRPSTPTHNFPFGECDIRTFSDEKELKFRLNFQMYKYGKLE